MCKLIFPDGEKMEHRELKPATRVREFTEEEYWALGPKPVHGCFLIIREE